MNDFDPLQAIKQIANRAQFAELDWQSFTNAMREGLTPSMPSSLNGSERVSGGDHSDPTISGLYSRDEAASRYNDVCGALQRARDAMNHVANVMGATPRYANATELAQAKKNIECQCRHSLEPWSDPLCDRTNLDGRMGLSFPCYQRKRQWMNDPEGYTPRPAARATSHTHDLSVVDGPPVHAFCSCGDWSGEFGDRAELTSMHAEHVAQATARSTAA